MARHAPAQYVSMLFVGQLYSSIIEQLTARVPVNCQLSRNLSRMLPFALFVLSLLAVASSETGSCPPSISVDTCTAVCGSEAPCANTAKLCCPTDCGGAICVDPVTARHSVNMVKPGLCPANPRGPWVCTHTCTGDSDCPRALKCCANRCGALTCQRPDTE